MDTRVRAATASTAYYGRLIPQVSDEEEVAAALAALDAPSDAPGPSQARSLAVSAARSLRNAVLPEKRFYRVLTEAKLFSIDFGEDNGSLSAGSDPDEDETDDPRRRAPTLAGSDYKVVRIQELSKTQPGRTASARSRQQMMQQQQERNGYSVMKMPEEVVASSGRLQCLFGASNAPTWFIRLAHVENAFMMLSTKDLSKTSDSGANNEKIFLELLPENEEAIVTKGRFYYRVMVPIELRKAPDLLAPVISRFVFKNAEEIIECHETFRCPQSGVTFVKLAYEDGWLFETLNSGIKVQGYAVTRDLPKFYRVLVPVYLRSAPDFECPRLPGVAPMTAGTVFESSLQYTPPGSRITYIKVASESHSTGSSAGNGWLFNQTPSGDEVLEAVDEEPEKKNGKFYFRVISEKKEVLLSPERSSEVVRYLFANTIFSAEMEYTLPRTQETYVRLTKEKGWVALDPLRPRTGSFSTRSSNRSIFNMQSNSARENDDEPPRTLARISEELYNLYAMPPSWVSIGFPNRTWFKVPDESCRTILAEETLLQMSVFESRNILASSSQGRDSVPLTRKGTLSLDDGNTVWTCTLEEIKHPASALLFTFPWKQVWWIFEVEGSEERHCVELQHGLRGGFRSVLFDGEQLLQNRSVTDMLWDSGSEFSFAWGDHTFKVLITLEGAFFSQYLQFYSYTLVVDEENIVPVEP
ncbi:hypothetical protein PHYBOEH_009526 [Phytophthora boehmeriae]|uniref:Uncharacterized protein n=1 Tax=Phytophthora boehmeriae TaxID=109152 RepID=A0A8T1X447_9STRA|nr:hypothetical protein PHYBOEH_009526 [Phytophthora boehmeriae]